MFFRRFTKLLVDTKIIQPEAGQVYYSQREDIDPPKKKYQLYFDDETVLLVNTSKSKRNVSVFLPQKDCTILDYDSYICIDNVFRFERSNPVLKVQNLSTNILKNLRTMIRASNGLTGIQINKLEQKISMVIANREE